MLLLSLFILMLKLSQWQPIQAGFSVHLTYSHDFLIHTWLQPFPYFFNLYACFVFPASLLISLCISGTFCGRWYLETKMWVHGYILKKTLNILKITFQLQLLQNIGYICHVVWYILEPILYPIICTSPFSLLVTTSLFSIFVSLFFFCYVCVLSHSVTQLFQLFANLWTIAHQVPLSMGFSRQEYWRGLPCPPPEDLPDLGIEPASPALAGGFFATSATWEAPFLLYSLVFFFFYSTYKRYHTVFVFLCLTYFT